MTTNGYLLTPEVFERLLKLKVYNYQITIDGVQENHDKYRTLKNGAPTFEKIIDNLQNISKNIKSNAFKIAIRANITKESFEHIDEFMDLMYKEFHHDKRFTVFFRPVGDWGGERVKLIKSNLLEKENALFSKLLTYKNSGEYLGKPVLVVRKVSEREESIGANMEIVGTEETNIFNACMKLLSDNSEYKRRCVQSFAYGDGKASMRIVDRILEIIEK